MLKFRSDKIARQGILACCDQIRWLVEHVAVEAGELTVNGWAVVPAHENVSAARFLVGGEDFDHLNYPVSSPDLAVAFPAVSGAQAARFFSRTRITEATFNDGFACLEFLVGTDTELARQTAWYYPDPDSADRLALPEEGRIRRVIGDAETRNYLLGGAAVFKRFDYYLDKQLGRPLRSFSNVLDWGCGSGRVSRHFHLLPEVKLWGVDIDDDNIHWCQSNLPHGKFSTIPVTPKTDLPDNYFDLVIGISVFTHLDEDSQFTWLEELQRVTKPGAILMLSVHGLALTGLYGTSPKITRLVEKKGFYNLGRNSNLDDVMAGNTHYLDVIQSRDYIRREWGKYFTVLDIVDALAANQDTVVLRKK